MTSADPALHDQPTPGVFGPLGKVLGRAERLLRVQLFRDPLDGVQGARTGKMTTGPWVLDPDGRPTGAAASVIMDNTLATSLHAAEPALRWLVTTELQLNILRPLPQDGTELEAWTRTRVADHGGGLATGTLVGTDGTEYVQASGWFQSVGESPAQALRDFEQAAQLPLGPETESPLGMLLGLDPDSLTPPGADRPAVTDQFQDGLRFQELPQLRNPHGAVHGGAMTAMAALAAQQAMPDRRDFDLQSLRVVFLRPAGGPITARTRVRHAGRSLRVVEVELVGAAGKPFIHTESVFRTAR
ncbi:PaaI family thioesterase [Micrococcus terreus]|uniref:PaaI family thioesterase n=1 Tax=Micrococcus terreus TaxID=574650 RepID=UPI0023F919D4|nr:acyl-CoA thioesterase domain-containing protein [Micrococcus terreus]